MSQAEKIAFSADQSCEQSASTLPPTAPARRFLAARIDATGQQGSEADRAARLGPPVSAREMQIQPQSHFRIGSGEALAEQPAVDAKVISAGDQRHQRIADSAALGAMRFAVFRRAANARDRQKRSGSPDITMACG